MYNIVAIYAGTMISTILIHKFIIVVVVIPNFQPHDSCVPGTHFDGAQESWPYYHGAIMESGTGSFWSYITMDAAEGNWQQVLNATRCRSEAEIFGDPRDPIPQKFYITFLGGKV